MKNDAFLSYAHRGDLELAAAVEKGLEHLARPLLAIRAMEVFRDRNDFAANAGLQPALEAQLAASRWLIVLASPAAALSTYCQKELQWWLAHRGTAQLLIALTDGELHWSPSDGDFDWTRTTALAPVARGAFTDEPFHVDLRPWRQPPVPTLRHPGFRAAMLDLAAPIRGVPKNLLDHEDVRRQRRARALLQAGVATVTLLALLASGAAYVAREQARLSLARQLSAQAVQLARERRPDLAMLLGAQALHEADSPDGRRALLEVLLDQPHLVRVRQGVSQAGLEAEGYRFAPPRARNGPPPLAGDGRPLACDGGAELGRASADGRWAAYGCYGGAVGLAGPQGWRALRGQPRHEQPVTGLAFSADGQVLASAGHDGRILLWHVPTGLAMPPAFTERERPIVALGWQADRRELLSLHDDRSAKVWRFDPQPRWREAPAGGLTLEEALTLPPDALDPDAALTWLQDDAQRLAEPLPGPAADTPFVGWAPDARPVHALPGDRPGPTPAQLDPPSGLVWSSRVSPDGDRAALVLTPADGPRRTLALSAYVQAAAMDPAAQRLALAAGERVQLLGWPDTQALSPPQALAAEVTQLRFGPEARWLVAGLADGSLQALQPGTGTPLREPLPAHAGPGGVHAMGSTRDGLRLVTGGGDAQLKLWDTTRWELLASLPVHGVERRGGGPLGGAGRVAAVAVRDDAQMLAATTDEGFALWMQGSSPWARRAFRAPGVDALAFTPDGEALRTHGPAGLQAWSFSVVRLQALACAVAGRQLSLAEWEEYMSFGTGPQGRWLQVFDPAPRDTCPPAPG